MRQCPKCRGKVEVLQTRATLAGFTSRRYQCQNGHRFSTREFLSDATNKDGTLKPLSVAQNSALTTLRKAPGYGSR